MYMFKEISVYSTTVLFIGWLAISKYVDHTFMDSNFFVVQQFCGSIVLSNVSDQLYSHLMKFMFIPVKLLYK